MTWFLILIAILIFIFLIYMDFYFGRRHHENNIQNMIFPISTGDYEYYHLGSLLFQDMLQDIKHAKQEVLLQFFIMKKDNISTKISDLLIEKAKEGVTVRVLVDRIGGFRLSYFYRARLKKAGVHFAFSSRPTFPFLLYKFNRRNHRKIAVIDGKAAYVGGFNIGDEYESKNPTFHIWRDYHVRITGKVVRDIQKIFQADWKLAKKEISVYKPSLRDSGKEVQAVATDGFGLEEIFLEFINKAKYEMMIGTPYFIPTKPIIEALEKAIDRGVNVKLLVPLKSDHPFVKEAGIPYYFRLKNKGAEVKLFHQGFFHGKIFILDDKLCDIGTANFDPRSFYWNKEVNMMMYDKMFIQEVKKAFLKDFHDSMDVSEKWWKQLSWWTKLKIKFVPLVRKFL